MAKILAISSQVASGHVGLSAIVPALQVLGHEVIALPTVLLANHPGKQATSGTRIEPDVLNRMLETLAANGRLADLDAVLTGYLPSAGHVAFAKRAVETCREISGGLTYLCDPVIGDDPKGIYIETAAAEAIRDALIPIANITTPNRFELAWLTGRDVTDAASATAAATQLSEASIVIAKSVPLAGDRLATHAIVSASVTTAIVPRRDKAPNGTGDLLSALILAATFNDHLPEPDAKLQWAIAEVDHVLRASAEQPELALTQALSRWLV